MSARTIPLALLLLTAAAGARGQEATRATIRWTGIVAIVGDSVITDLDMGESLSLWRAEQQREPPAEGTPEFEAIFRTLLEDRITTLLLVQAALRDTTIRVTDEEVDRAVQQQIDTVRSQFQTPVEFENALRSINMSADAFRDNTRAQIRRSFLARAYLNQARRDRKPPPVSDGEIREFFAQQGGQVPTIPPGIVYEQILIPITASDTAKARARQKADSILAAIREGSEFEAMARQFSEDGSREFGGDLGWFRPGQMVPEFERATWLLKTGEVGGPVETVHGFHIIKLERIRGPERSARHILIRPVLTDGDTERARSLAEEVAAKWRAGASLDSLRRVYGDREQPVRVGPVARDSLAAGFREALQNAEVGRIVGPFEVGRERQQPRFVLARATELTDSRPATVDDYRARIQTILADRKLNEEIIADLRRKTHVEIRRPGSEPDR